MAAIKDFCCKLTKFRMVALTLMKPRLNSSFTDLGYRFQVGVSSACRYFHRWIYIFFKLFHWLMFWPDEREDLLSNIPSYFRSTFKDMITIIVDCFEIFIDLFAAAQGFSVYKHHTTLKFLIRISITEVIIFVSRGYGGRASDKKVPLDNVFLDHLQQGDIILGDKWYLIENEVKEKGAFLRMPCFVNNWEQLHPYEVEQSTYYSTIRIHVEGLISVVREKLSI